MGVPVLLNEAESVFNRTSLCPEGARSSWSITMAKRLLSRPKLGQSVKSPHNYQRFADLLRQRSACAHVLVIGSGTLGEGMQALTKAEGIELVETDVQLKSRTSIICDAHNLPFADGTFEGVIAQAVLEHVADPYCCVAEIHRVLRPGGLVYAETPFMQQVHMGAYDFTRFTPLGHRRLFRWFAEIDSGSGGGPAIVLAWAWQYFLIGWANTPRGRQIAEVLGRLTAFWLKYLDRFMIDRRGAQDGTWGYYFLGDKQDHPLPDREIVRQYRGVFRRA